MALVEKPLRLNLPIVDILADYRGGMSIKKVAAKYNCSPQAIKTRLIKEGVEIRPKESYPSPGRKKKPKPIVDHAEIAARLERERVEEEAKKQPKPKMKKIGW
jgi:transposase